MQSNLLVKVAWVGPHLGDIVEDLEQNGDNYLILHYSPSALVKNNNLTPILFPECRNPLSHSDNQVGSDPNCFFTANKMAKIVWRPLEDGAPLLYKLIEHFGLSNELYNSLLSHYSAHKNDKTLEDIACSWLNGPYENGTRYDKLSPKWKKPTLYIGGIFPIGGTKYRAPELAAVAKMAIDDINSNKSKILTDHQLKLDINDGKCEADVVMKRFIDIIKTKDSHRFRSTVGMLGITEA